MEKKLLEMIKDAVYRKRINLESIKVYNQKYEDGSNGDLIVINDLYEFHLIGGFSNFKSNYSRKGSLVKLAKNTLKEIAAGKGKSVWLNGDVYYYTYTLIEEVRA